MKPSDFAGLILLGALWGGSFLFIRVAVPALGPFLLVEWRVALAGVALFIYAAEIYLTASLAAILNSTTVMFTAIVATVWMGDALTARKFVGIIFGIVGVTVLVGWDPVALNGVVLLSVVAMLAASLSYALGATYAKHAFSGIPPLGMAIGQLSGATALLLPLAVVSLPEVTPSVVVTLSMLGLALLSTAVAYLIYFRLIENVGPTSTVTVTLLVPVFGLLFGVLLLEEPFGLGTLAGLGIILTSVVFITGIAPRKNKLEGN